MFDKFFNRDGVRVSQVDWSDAEAVRAAFLRRVLGWFFEPLADFPRDGHDAFPVLMATFTGLCAAERAVASGSAMMEIDESIDTTTSHQIYAACNYLIQHGSLTPRVGISGTGRLWLRDEESGVIVLDPWVLRDAARAWVGRRLGAPAGAELSAVVGRRRGEF